MTQAGLALRLEAAQALLALGRHDEAADAFSLLKQWTSEGDITFPYMAGIMPVSVRQQAARGLAQVWPLHGHGCCTDIYVPRWLGHLWPLFPHGSTSARISAVPVPTWRLHTQLAEVQLL